MEQTPDERAAALYRRIISPTTGEFIWREPTRQEIAAAIRAAIESAVLREREACAAEIVAQRDTRRTVDSYDRGWIDACNIAEAAIRAPCRDRRVAHRTGNTGL